LRERAGSGEILHAQEFVNTGSAIGIIPIARSKFMIGLTQLPIAFLLELEAVACESPYSTA
jgi:hypothetical protein